jgi:signal transduction histidine kinase
VQRLRAEVEAHVGWLVEAERVRLSVSSATKNALQSAQEVGELEAVQDWLAECRLAAQTPLKEVTVSESHRDACEAVEIWLRRLSFRRSHPEATDLTALSLAEIRVTETLSALVAQVRRQTAEISGRLGTLWTILTVLGVALVGVTGALSLSLFAYRRRAELLRKAKEAVEESELELEKRVRQRTEELEESSQMLEQEIAERKQLETEILEIERCERERIGADLHDGLAQQLVAISLFQKSLEDKLASQEMPEAEAAGEISHFISEAIAQSRALARGLAPLGSTTKGLRPALKRLAADAEVLFGVPCQVRTDGSDSPLSLEATNHLFRIAQEAVHNAAKHAGASQIVIELTAMDSELALRVVDDGVGMPDAATDGEGIGLRLMKHRASLIGGSLSVQQGPQGGTTVVCRFSRESKGDVLGSLESAG